MAKRKGGGFYAFPSGRRIYPLDLKPSEIEVQDIARSLSNMCRFAGHLKMFYSVAQHCSLAYDLASDENKAWALLHDASEYALVDLPRPLKYSPRFGEYYRKHEAHVMEAICVRFGLDPIEPAEVAEIDLRLCATEQRDLQNQDKRRPKPYDFTITGIVPWEAEKEWLRQMKELGLE